VVVSNRLHALLLAGLCGAVPIALTSLAHQKVIGVFDSLGLSELTIDAEAASARGRLFDLLTSSTRYIDRVKTAFDRQRTFAEMRLKQLMADLA
jgi:hypothetical protein